MPLIKAAVTVFLLTILSFACFTTRMIGPNNSVQLFNCVDDGATDVLTQAILLWPELSAPISRLDVFCVDRDRIDNYSVCGRSGAKQIDGCTAWIGSSGLLGARARVYVAKDRSLSRVLAHEVQHMRPSIWSLPDACMDHRLDCWDPLAEKRLKEWIDE